MKNPKLELTWIGKENRPKLEPRILLEDPARSYHAAHRVTDRDIFDNRLIFGDNLLALKALEAEFAGKVKCVFIDPPYNTGSAFTHYDDGLEHSIWLSLMRDRLEIIRRLLSEDGSLWITIDDNEAHYLKVLCDEVFGRANFVANAIWEKADSPRNSARQFSTDHDHVLVFSKNPEWLPLRLSRTDEANAIYSNPDHDPRGSWLPGDPYANKPYSRGQYKVTGPTGREFSPPPGRFWRISEERLRELDADGRIWWGPNCDARPSIKRYLSEVGDLVPRTLWSKNDVGSNRTSKNEMRALFPGDESFGTPKPERLLERVLNIATCPNDLVLDSFAGSGTTGAVAHKMGRRWIMVELGEHCHTHIIPRLKKVIDGEDPGGITKTVNWQGGGGFPLLPTRALVAGAGQMGQLGHQQGLQRRHAGRGAVQAGRLQLRAVRRGVLAARPFHRARLPLRHHRRLNHEQLQQLSDEVGSERTLLVLCPAFRGCGEYPNLTVKKIPKQVLNRCEWGHDDYSPAGGESASKAAHPALSQREREQEKDALLSPRKGVPGSRDWTSVRN